MTINYKYYLLQWWSQGQNQSSFFLSFFLQNIISFFTLLLLFFSYQRLKFERQQVSSSLQDSVFNILSDLNNTLIWMVFTCPLFPNLSVLLLIVWELFQVHQLQLVSPLLSLLHSLRVFHTSVCRLFFTGVRVTSFLFFSRSLLNILADLNNGVVVMVSIRPLIS